MLMLALPLKGMLDLVRLRGNNVEQLLSWQFLVLILQYGVLCGGYPYIGTTETHKRK